VGVARYLPGGSPKMLSLAGSRRLLFPAPETLMRQKPLYLVEGEPAAVSVRSCGLQAVAVPGAQSWRMEFAQRLMPFNVIVLPDCDSQGRELAARVVRALPRVRTVDLDPGRQDGWDVGDAVAEASTEGGLSQVRRMLEQMAA
jgi:5S rRNA maturation endonuclease (ribonuclease M5)